MRRIIGFSFPAVVLALFSGASPALAEGKYSLKEAAVPPPSQLKPSIRGLFEDKCLQVLDGSGSLYCEVWLRKSVPAKATEAQVKNGLTYRELTQTTLVGAVRFAQDAKDYRNQDVKAGVYTLRLAFQPQDGDHMGTAPHIEFCLLVSAEADTKPDLMEPKSLHNLSAKSLEGGHPGVILLFPNPKPEPTAKIVDQGMGHWVIRAALPVEVNGNRTILGIGLNVVGHSAAS